MTATSASHEREGIIPVVGTELAYVTLGSGPPLVIVHGGPGLGHSYLRPAMDVLRDRHRLIYYDQRGSGRSEPGQPRPDFVQQAIEDLDALRAGIGLERMMLLGHSWGADLALLYAGAYPERVNRLVAANPGPPFWVEHLEAMAARAAARMTAEDTADRQRVMATDDFRRRDPAAVEEYIRLVFSPMFNDPRTPAQIDWGFTQVTADHVVDAEEQAVGELLASDPAPTIAAVQAPVLIVHGENDPIPVAFSERIASVARNAQLRLLPGASHFAYLEDPDAFFGVVRPFLDR